MDNATRRGRVVVLACLLLAGCSMQRIVGNGLADALSADGGGAFSRDEDLAFLGEAVPFALKLMESSAANAPGHVAIRQALAAGFAQYAAVYVDWPAEQLRFTDYAAYTVGEQRARAFYRRAAGYATDALELAHPGWQKLLQEVPAQALAGTAVDDVPAMFWLAAAWLLPLGSSVEDPELLARVPLAAQLLQRCEALEPDWNDGAVNEALIGLEPRIPGPDPGARAERRFEAAIATGTRIAPYLGFALAVALPQQDRERFRALLEQALAIPADANPETQLANLYAQQRARFYLDHLDDLFL